VLWNEDANRIV